MSEPNKPDKQPLEWMCPFCDGAGTEICPAYCDTGICSDGVESWDCEECHYPDMKPGTITCENCNGLGWLGYEPLGHDMPSREVVRIEPKIKRVRAFKTEDGQLFEKRSDAERHQKEIS